jgi:hypothetical protein
MSILIQKLKAMAESAVPAMGFRTASASARSKGPLVVAVLSHPDAKSAAAAVQAGAGALLMQPVDARVARQVVESAGGVPCGINLEKDSGIDIEGLKKAGCDFIVFSPASAPASWVRQEGLGKLARLAPTVEAAALRGIDRVGIDAVLLDRWEDAGLVSVQFLMSCYFLSGSLGKPLLAMVPADLEAADAGSLWDAGVDGMVLEALPSKLTELHKAAAALPPRTRKKAGRDTALLPHVATAAEPAEEEGEDD